MRHIIRYKNYLIIALILAATHTFAFHLKNLIDYCKGYSALKTLETKKEHEVFYFGLSQKDSQAYVAVIIPDRLTLKNEQADITWAMELITKRSERRWMYVGTEKHFGHTGFVFKALPPTFTVGLQK